MSFTCLRCGQECATKWSLKCHLKRKKLCAPVTSDREPRELLDLLVTRNHTTPSQGHSCELCGKTFTCRQSKYAHRQICKAKSQNIKPKENSATSSGTCTDTHTESSETHSHSHENNMSSFNGLVIPSYIEDILSRVQELETRSHQSKENFQINVNNHNNTTSTTNNTTTNVTINAYGCEDTTHLTQPFLDRCVKRTDKGLVELIETIHFHPAKPQNANLRISNKKLPFIERNNGVKWIYDRKDRVIEDLMEKGTDIMQNHFDDHEDRLSDKWSQTMYEHVKVWLDEVRDVRDKRVEELIQDIYLLILNNS